MLLSATLHKGSPPSLRSFPLISVAGRAVTCTMQANGITHGTVNSKSGYFKASLVQNIMESGGVWGHSTPQNRAFSSYLYQRFGMLFDLGSQRQIKAASTGGKVGTCLKHPQENRQYCGWFLISIPLAVHLLTQHCKSWALSCSLKAAVWTWDKLE